MTQQFTLFSQEKKSSTTKPNFMVLDVETRRSAKDVGGWDKAAQMGVSVAVLYDSVEDSFTAYIQDELPNMFKRLQQAELVIGFNIIRFDYTVLQPFADFDLKQLPTLDMLLHVQKRLSHRLSLDSIAIATLNVGKSADGMQALVWWREGKIEEITKYCQQDVDITKQVYLYGRENGYLMYADKFGKISRVDVDFS